MVATLRTRAGSWRKSRRLISAGVVVLLATAGLASAPANASPESVAVQLAVSPSTELTNGQTVTVTVSGLVPGDAVWPVEDCASYCQRHLTPSKVADAKGQATFVVPVERYLWDSLFGVWSNPPLDCAYVTSCRIRLAHHDDTYEEGFAFPRVEPDHVRACGAGVAHRDCCSPAATAGRHHDRYPR